MSKGLSFETFGALVGHHKQTLYEWVESFPEFGDAKKKADLLCQLWWENAGINGMLLGKGFNAAVWIFNMRNRFKWTNGDSYQVQQTQEVKISYTDEEKQAMKAQIKALMEVPK